MKEKLLKILPVIILSLFSGSVFSQDNPNLDQLPRKYYDFGIGAPAPLPFVVTGTDYFDNFDIGVDFAEPHLVVNPNNALNSFTIYNNTSTATGITPHVTLDGVNWSTIHPSWGQPMRGDPVAAFDSLGNLYAENMYGDPNILGTRIAKSTNGGLTWSSVVNGNIGVDKNWIAADQTGGPYANYVYGTMTAQSGGNIMRSTDFGATFNVVANVPQSLPGMMVCVGPNKSGGNIPGGCVYVVTNTGNAFAAVYTFYKSTDGGATYSNVGAFQYANYVGMNMGGRHSVENFRTRPYPFITADNSYGPNRGRLYLIYASNFPVGDGNKPDIWCRYSDDQASSWSAPVRVNDDINPEAHHQWHPSTWCDKKTGRLFIKWLDTRDCPTSDSCLVYATYSDDGGVTFAANQKISQRKFKINCSCGGGGQPGQPIYQGDYDAINSNGRNSIMAWTDFRNSNFASYTAYFPDYAMKTSVTNTSVASNDSSFVNIIVPAVKLYTDRVKFTATLDSLPTSGSLQLSFVNGKDSITSFPDSVRLRIKAVGTVNSRVFKITVKGSGPGGVPVHTRNVDLLVNSSYLSIGSNRPGLVTINVNGTPYTTSQTLTYVNGTNITLQAVTPSTGTQTRYVFQNWSNGGSNPQTFAINSSQNIIANYKPQYKLTGTSPYSVAVTGSGSFFDSAAPMQFAIATRRVNQGGTMFYFHSWYGTGVGAYTSPDSSGRDSLVNWKLSGPTIEQAIWSDVPIGVHNTSVEVPVEYNLLQNYPNPFNPTTNIRFDLPKSSFVSLRIYDMLGKEVAIVLEKNLQAASYMVDFNASELPSGIYFYKLQAGDFTSIKKMTLIK